MYYNAAMTLTVRLPAPLEDALQDYCAAHGLTRSQVVQECLAEYLARPAARAAPASAARPSRNFAAFRKAGLVGSVAGNGTSATREVVRRRVQERPQRKA
jgi:hypothetical protein